MSENFVRDFKSRYEQDISELRTRLFLSIITLVIAISVCFYFADYILSILVKPLASSYQLTQGRKLIFTGLMDAFLIHLKVAWYFGFLISLPYLLYQTYTFLAPGLYAHEKKNSVVLNALRSTDVLDRGHICLLLDRSLSMSLFFKF